jgi:hypothetical protein
VDRRRLTAGWAAMGSPLAGARRGRGASASMTWVTQRRAMAGLIATAALALIGEGWLVATSRAGAAHTGARAASSPVSG